MSEQASDKRKGWRGDSEGHAAAGKKGGIVVSQNRAYMAEIGRRGGKKTAQDHAHLVAIAARGRAKMAQDRERIAESGRTGTESKK